MLHMFAFFVMSCFFRVVPSGFAGDSAVPFRSEPQEQRKNNADSDPAMLLFQTRQDVGLSENVGLIFPMK